MKAQPKKNSISQKWYSKIIEPRFVLIITLFCSIGFVMVGCSDNSTGTNGGGGGNGNGNGNGGGGNENRPVSYSEDIQPIFNGNCASSGCHDSGTQQNGVDLSSYAAATSSVGARYDTLIIIPNDPAESPIIDKISNDNPEFGDRMPLGRGSLSQANIDSIRAWIEDGAPDN